MGAATTLFSYFTQAYDKQQRLDAGRQVQHEAADAQFQRVVSEYRADCEAAALSLAEKYHWKRGEAGFDTTSQEEQQVVSLMQEGNIRGLVSVMNGVLAKRPRDPFLIASLVGVSASAETNDRKLEALSNQCKAAQDLVPPSVVYDSYRLMIAYGAADIMARSMTEVAQKVPLADSEILRAQRGVALWENCLALNPDDPTGELRERKAWMLAEGGKIEDAIQLAQSVERLRDDTLRYCYNMACLHSQKSHDSTALLFLRRAAGLPGFDPQTAWQDRRFDSLMTGKERSQFTELLRVQWKWDVKFGFLNDDILLRNDSPFAITHVVFNPGIRAGGKLHGTDLKADIILPGHTHKWTDVVSIPGSKIDTAGPSLHCDQSH